MYSPKDRKIYFYHNGERVIAADPLIIARRIADAGAEFQTACGAATGAAGKWTRQAQDEVAKHLRTIFNLKPLTNGEEVIGTLSDDECADLFLHFREFQKGVKKNSRMTVTPARAVSPSSGPTSVASPPTSNTSASASTNGDSSTAKPPSSPTGPASPSGLSPLTKPISTP